MRLKKRVAQKRLVKGLALFSVLVAFFAFVLYFYGPLSLTITGLSIFRSEKADDALPQEDSLPEPPPIELESDFVDLNTNDSVLPPWWGAGGGSGNGATAPDAPFLGYRLTSLREGLVILLDGVPVDTTQVFFEGVVRFMLQERDAPLSEFSLDFDRDVSLAGLIASVNVSEGKSVIHSPTLSFMHHDLFIPRIPGHTQVRVCSNASSLVHVYEGCGDEDFMHESVVSLLDDRLDLAYNDTFFVLRNITGTGGVSELDSISPLVTLQSPQHNVGGATGNGLSFHFTAADASAVDSCSFYFDGDFVGAISNVTNYEAYDFEIADYSVGRHAWEVECTDVYGQVGLSESRSVVGVAASDYSGQTTNFSAVNMAQISNLTLDVPSQGRIVFTEDVNLSDGGDLDQFVVIGEDFIRIDSEFLPALNRSAVLTLYNPPVVNPVILVDGVLCSACEILATGDDLVFSVPHFSEYVATENSQLLIYDSTDSATRSPGQQVDFFANYSNITSSAPITGAGTFCNVTFSDSGPHTMTYNAGAGLYEYNRSFAAPGTHPFTVLCDGSSVGFTALNATDHASIQSPGARGPQGATVVAGTPETAPADAPGNTTAYAGNLTELIITGYSTTQSWQGYVGNVSGTIQLVDADDNVLYNWSALSTEGEIYATSAFDINFPSIQCANASHVAQEESLIGQNTTDVDSVNNTFTSSNHPLFYVGETVISANSCLSINLFNATGVQTSYFREVLLGDGALNVVYTALLEQNLDGFDSATHDFQMIVGENGHGNNISATPYYFFLELQ